MIVQSTEGEPYAIVEGEALYFRPPPQNDLTAPEPSPELAAALKTAYDPI
jgi:hypothetical protein